MGLFKPKATTEPERGEAWWRDFQWEECVSVPTLAKRVVELIPPVVTNPPSSGVVSLKCPSCGAPLNLQRAECEYCGTPYSVDGKRPQPKPQMTYYDKPITHPTREMLEDMAPFIVMGEAQP